MFVLTSLLAVAVIGFVGVRVLMSAGRREAVSDAKDLAVLAGRGIVQPSLTDPLVRGDPVAVAVLDRVVHDSVLGPRIVRVKIVSGDGRIVYSDARALIGARYPLGPQELASLASGTVVAEQHSNLAEPQNRFERGLGSLLEVYLPVHTAGHTKLLFEAYLPSSEVSASARNLWLAFAPALFGGLVLLELVLVPLGWSLARRVRRSEQQRAALLAHAVEASHEERRRIARDLHDGVVQDLAGIALSLASAAQAKTRAPDQRDAQLLRDAARKTRQSIRALRSLLVEIYPPNLLNEGLQSALEDLLEGVAVRGLDADLDFDPALSISQDDEALLYRVAQEGVRNVSKHARAARVTVRVEQTAAAVVLSINDDGVGFDADQLERSRAAGHVGLGLLADMVREHGGLLDISSTPGRGTTLRMELPQR